MIYTYKIDSDGVITGVSEVPSMRWNYLNRTIYDSLATELEELTIPGSSPVNLKEARIHKKNTVTHDDFMDAFRYGLGYEFTLPK